MSYLYAPVWLAITSTSFNLDAFLSGSVGASLVALAIWIVKLLLDRFVPSRADSRANIGLLIENLKNMVEVLQEEKRTDAQRLADKQARVDVLEAAADADYEKILELRTEVQELRKLLGRRNHHITILVTSLRQLGAEITGLEHEVTMDSLEITMPNTRK